MKELLEICGTCKHCDILNINYHICTIKKKIVAINDWCSYYKSYEEIKQKIEETKEINKEQKRLKKNEVDGKNTDLKYNGKVFDIEFELLEEK